MKKSGIIKKIFYKLPASYIIMFHHIDDGNIIYKSNCVLTYNSFIEILDSGLEFASVDYILTDKYLKNKCAITFDDGLQDVYDIAFLELKKRNIPFCIFVITDLLDTEGYITTDELLEMAQCPLVTIGSHGKTHKILKGMSFREQFQELSESKKILEKIIDRPVKYFAFSHGQFDKFTRKILQKNKLYDFAFGTKGYPLNIITKTWRYDLPRINFENNKTLYSIFEYKGKYKLVKKDKML